MPSNLQFAVGWACSFWLSCSKSNQQDPWWTGGSWRQRGFRRNRKGKATGAADVWETTCTTVRTHHSWLVLRTHKYLQCAVIGLTWLVPCSITKEWRQFICSKFILSVTFSLDLYSPKFQPFANWAKWASIPEVAALLKDNWFLYDHDIITLKDCHEGHMHNPCILKVSRSTLFSHIPH